MKENLKAAWQKVLNYQVAKWNSADIGCNVGWLIIWALVGFMALWFKNSVLPWLYLALFVYSIYFRINISLLSGVNNNGISCPIS